MKYVAYWEFDSEDTDALLSKFLKVEEARKKQPDKYPKNIFPPHYTAANKGLSIVEGDEHQLVNWTLYYYPEMKISYVPLLDSAEVAEKYAKSKKA